VSHDPTNSAAQNPRVANLTDANDSSATSCESSDGFAINLVNSIFELYVEPELIRRKLKLNRDEIRKVTVELSPDRPDPRVRLNDEAEIVAQVRFKRDVAEGEDVTAEDIGEIYAVAPSHVGPNSGYVCFAVVNGQQCIKFDFRYNKARVARLLLRAHEFLDTAVQCLDERPAVTCDLAFSAAELSVQAQMLLQQRRTKSHLHRQEWIDSWTELDNAPKVHADALRTLRDYRIRGRYGDAVSRADRTELGQLMDVVNEMIKVAETYAGQPALNTADHPSRVGKTNECNEGPF
jgi:hypothetical protein